MRDTNVSASLWGRELRLGRGKQLETCLVSTAGDSPKLKQIPVKKTPTNKCKTFIKPVCNF